jgi:hypothetical protein
MNRTVVNNTESEVRLIVVESGHWDLVRRQVVGGGPREIARVSAGCTFVVPAEFDPLPLLIESPAFLCSRTTVEIDPSVFGKGG